jgi:multiple sugar transport system permease protein
VSPVSGAKRRRQRILVALSLGIPTAYMAFFLGGPLLKAIDISLTNLALAGPQAAHAQFVGANNFSTLFTSAQFWDGLRASIEYLVGSAVIGQDVAGFGLALFVERLGKLARTILLSVVVLPWIIPEIAAAFIWSGFLSVPNGLVNTLLSLLGIAPVSFLYKYPMLSLIVANAWRGIAFSVLVLGAALRSVPAEVIEAAKLD